MAGPQNSKLRVSVILGESKRMYTTGNLKENRKNRKNIGQF